ncbi:transporter substrate-binding domain-containing protein [uncultured Marinobacter sp.]|uniref:substrate-binding periplasmic protein n=1 Tax=uncultured Marinobacter sp. TaxID=187379 RepID=UPI002604FAE9|nr:transporter substrate-binding domain-containing protein [uncultured Marinobacter sp.]
MPNRTSSHPALFPVLLLPLLISSFVLTGLAYAANSAPTSNAKTLHFNVSPNGYPPYLIVEGQQPSGIMWDVVTLIAERIGYEVVPEQIPRKRVDEMLLTGYIDATSRAVEWTDNPEQFLFTDAIVEVEEVVFIPTDSDLTYQTPEDLFSQTVVTHLGYLYPLMEPHFQSGAIKRFDVSRDRDMFAFLLHGEHFDAAIADRLVGQWILRNEGWRKDFRISKESLSNYGFRLMLRKDQENFARRFNAELANIRENGELDAILSQYR